MISLRENQVKPFSRKENKKMLLALALAGGALFLSQQSHQHKPGGALGGSYSNVGPTHPSLHPLGLPPNRRMDNSGATRVRHNANPNPAGHAHQNLNALQVPGHRGGLLRTPETQAAYASEVHKKAYEQSGHRGVKFTEDHYSTKNWNHKWARSLGNPQPGVAHMVRPYSRKDNQMRDLPKHPVTTTPLGPHNDARTLHSWSANYLTPRYHRKGHDKYHWESGWKNGDGHSMKQPRAHPQAAHGHSN